MVNKVTINEELLDNLLTKALPQEYEVLLNDYQMSTDEETYFGLLIYLINTTINKVIEWSHNDGRSIIDGYDELPLDFWENIESNINSNFNNHYLEISLFLLGLYQEQNKITYSSLNKLPIFSQQDGSAFSILKQHNYNVVNDLLKDLNKNLRDTLWNGIKNNLSIDEIVENLVKSGLEPVGKFTPQTRAKMIAVTERSRIINTAKLQCYVDNGIIEFDIITAHDGRVCTICLNNEANNPYTIDEIVGMIPSHPSCRCTIKPRINNGQTFINDDFIPYIVDLTNY